MASWCDDADAKLTRDEAYALDMAGDDATGGYYETDWFEFGMPHSVTDELCSIIDRLTLETDLYHDIVALAEFTRDAA